MRRLKRNAKAKNSKRKIRKISFEKEPWYAAIAARMSAIRAGQSRPEVASQPLNAAGKYAR